MYVLHGELYGYCLEMCYCGTIKRRKRVKLYSDYLEQNYKLNLKKYNILGFYFKENLNKWSVLFMSSFPHLYLLLASSQYTSISAKVISCKVLPFSLAFCSKYAKRLMNFLLVRSKAVSTLISIKRA